MKFQKQKLCEVVVFDLKPFLILIIPVVFLALVSHFISVKLINEKSENIYNNMLLNTKNNIEARLNQIGNISVTIMYNNMYQKLLDSPFSKNIDQMRSDIENFYLISELRTMNYTTKNIEGIGLYLKKDNYIIHNYGIHTMNEFIDNTFTGKFENIDDIISKSSKMGTLYYLDSIQIYYGNRNINVMPFIRVISHDKSTLDGAVLLLIKKDFFEQVLPSPSPNSSSFAFIIDETDKIIAGLPVDKNQISGFASYNSNIIEKQKINSNDFCVLTTSIKDLPWKLVMYIPADSFYHMRSYSLFFYEIIVLFILVSLLLSFLMAFKKLKPVKIMISLIKRSFINYNTEPTKDNFSFIEKSIEELNSLSNLQKKEIEITKSLIREQFIVNIVSGQIPVHIMNCEKLSDIIQFNFENSNYIVILFELTGTEITESCSKAYAYEFVSILNKNSSEYFRINFVYKYSNKNILLIDWPEDVKILDEQYFIETLHSAKKQFELSKEITVIIGIGIIVQTIKEINKSFCIAKEALSYSILLKGNKTISSLDDIDNNKSQRFYYPLELESGLLIALKAGYYEKVNSILDIIAEENLNKRTLDSFSARCLYYKLCSTFEKMLSALGVDNNTTYIYNMATGLSGIDDIISYMKTTFNILCNKFSNDENNDVFTQISAFVDEHYLNSNISQKYLAEKFDVSSYSISRFFNQDMFSGFQNYINRKRINYSKELLRKTDHNISKIADLSGFTNENTFIRVFKQFERLTPGQYRTQAERS